MPPAACHVDPAVNCLRSNSTTSVQPAFVRWYSTLAPTTPPPTTTTCADDFISAFLVVRNRWRCRPRRPACRGTPPTPRVDPGPSPEVRTRQGTPPPRLSP